MEGLLVRVRLLPSRPRRPDFSRFVWRRLSVILMSKIRTVSLT